MRGFIRSYARVLNLDPEPLLADLNAKLAPLRESVVDGMATDFAAARAAGRERMFPHWAIGIALVILIALGVIGWQTTLQPAVHSQPPLEVVAVPAAAPAAAALPAPATPPVLDTRNASCSRAKVRQPLAQRSNRFQHRPMSRSRPLHQASPRAAHAPTMLLRFNGASWAEVTDRNGKILLSQLSSAGAEHALDGELPLTVVIGDANFASVEVRGAAFNLQPFTRNNVARFTSSNESKIE